MKKISLFSIILVLGLLLSACGSSSVDVMDENGENQSVNVDNSDLVNPERTREPGEFQFDIPSQTLLIVGTFELEETELAVQADQAAELLPLWQVLKGLLESETAAEAEVDALVDQIAETMTGEQMQAIESMDLTMENFTALNEELGLDSAFRRSGGMEDGEESSGFQRPEGMPEGLRPGGGPGGGGGPAEGLSPEELDSFRSTREAAGGGTGFGMRGGGMMNIPIIEALIELLQSK
jgi:hypothetical protein